MKLPIALRWLLVPVVSMVGCSTVGVASGVVRHGLVLAMGPQALEAALPTDVRYGFVNAAAAIIFVIAGAMVAPRFRMIVAVALYGVGAYVAWIVLNDWYFPEGHPRAYQVSHVPLSLTLVGGLLGVLITFVLVRRWEARSVTHSNAESSAPDEQQANEELKPTATPGSLVE